MPQFPRIENAGRYRERAEECRAAADTMLDHVSRAQIEQCARDYDRMAEMIEESLHQSRQK